MAVAPAPEPALTVVPASATAAEVASVPASAQVPATVEESLIPDDAADGDDDGEGTADEAGDEGESHDLVVDGDPNALRYTQELSDEELTNRWKSSPETLGSISIGFVDEGRIVNGERFPNGDGWLVVSPSATWATRETIDYVIAAIQAVRQQYPEAPPLRVNQISAPEGGFLRPHKSHQSGRDVDLGFYYPTVDPVRAREREKYIDVAKNWALLKALVTHADVQMILVDRRVQKVLYDYALSVGEDRAYLDRLFSLTHKGLVQHARRHRDHFHVRFYNPRAQELGRRVAPLLALRPDQNLRMHKVRRGDTLGGIAARYGSSVAALRKANHLRSNLLRIAQVLKVPLRGPCTQCPIPPPVIVPPRMLPPPVETAAVTPEAAPSAAVAEANPVAVADPKPAEPTVAVAATDNKVAAEAVSAPSAADPTAPAAAALGEGAVVHTAITAPELAIPKTLPTTLAGATAP